jgi:hypothetical protein
LNVEISRRSLFSLPALALVPGGFSRKVPRNTPGECFFCGKKLPVDWSGSTLYDYKRIFNDQSLSWEEKIKILDDRENHPYIVRCQDHWGKELHDKICKGEI